jgi:alkanesulfonate monooxygenase SsuD/methylene tetrahydromethanopterin reductase-like flavin-dependent oxidoreductase (luciferase family)
VTRYGFHASHEQVAPGQLLSDVRRAEQAGFELAMCSDHFSP